LEAMKSLCSVLLALVAQTALPQMNPIAGQVGDIHDETTLLHSVGAGNREP